MTKLERLEDKRDALAENIGQTKGYEPSAFKSGFNTAVALMQAREAKFIMELKKALPRAPSMDGTDSWTQCQKIVHRAIAEYDKEHE